MGFFDFLKREQRDSFTVAKYDPSMHSALFSGDTVNKIAVTEKTALQLSTVYACVKLIAESIAALPVNVFKEDAKGDAISARKSYAYKVLKNPNPYMTRYAFEVCMRYCAELRGNGYAYIERDDNYRPVNLWPIHPDKVSPIIKNGVLIYEIDGGQDYIDAIDMIHYKGLTKDGLVGLNPISVQAQQLSIGMSTQLTQKDFYEKGANLDGLLIYPNRLDKETRDKTVESWNQKNAGTGKSRIAVLDNGVNYMELGIRPGDAKYLESKNASAEEIARMFQVPLHLLQFPNNQTYASVEQLEITFVNHCLMPKVKMAEMEWEAKVFSEAEKENGFYVKYNMNALLRGDFKTRMEGYRILHSMGLPLNRILKLEDMNSVDGGDISLSPLNMISTGRLDEYHFNEKTASVPQQQRDLLKQLLSENGIKINGHEH